MQRGAPSSPHTRLGAIDSGGRVVVPKEVRERLGLRPGSRIVLTEVDGHVEISPATTPVRLVDQVGALVAVAEVELVSSRRVGGLRRTLAG